MGIRILLADDSVTAQNMGKKILSEAGHEVVTVSNGAAAFKKIAEMKPDLALLDVFMPGYSGLELCEKLRNAADTTRLPVILTVGKMEPYSPQDGARVKADGVIIKPFEASDLTAAVERLAQKLTPAPKSAAHERKSAKPANYEPTVRLDSKQIAEMLKSGGAESSKAESVTPSVEAVEASAPTVSSQAEEFHIASAPSEAQESGASAFGDQLASAAKAESMPVTMNSYMEEYLSDAPTVTVEPIASLSDQESSVQGQDQSSPVAISDELPVSRFESQISSDAPVAALDGFEPTAAAAVSEMPIVQEPGFETTQQSSEAVTAAMKDPALETDPHQATTAFPTKFGTAASDLYEAPITSVSQELIAESNATLEAAISGHFDGGSQELARPIDEFEERLQQAMAAYQSESEPTGTTPGESSAQHQSTDTELQIVAETPPTSENSDSFESRVQAAMQNFDDAGQAEEFSVETQHAASPFVLSTESIGTAIDEVACNTGSEAEEPQHRVETQHAASLPETPEIAAAAEFNESSAVNAIANQEITQPVPETDDTVIERVRESFSEHSVDGAPMPELGSDTDAVPMAMAAAAAATAPSFVSPSSVAAEREAAFEITRALSYAINAETSAETVNQPSATLSTETEARDENKMAGVVERVLQRELPSLVWKVMAEIDLEKQRR